MTTGVADAYHQGSGGFHRGLDQDFGGSYVCQSLRTGHTGADSVLPELK